MPEVITNILVYTRTLDATMVTWGVSPMFRAPAPWSFSLRASRSGVGDWYEVAVVQDQNWALDPNRWLYGMSPRLHYQVVMTAGGQQYVSPVRQAIGNFNQADEAIAREIMRKEQLRMRHAGGYGWLLKRRQWGVPCPDCLDHDTSEVTNASCPTCYGVGITGGYFAGVPYYFSDSNQGVRRRIEAREAQGVMEDRIRACRGINCPWLDTGDLWIRCSTDQRYFVQTVQEINYRDIPLIFDPVELRLAPATHVVYTVPRPDEPGSSSST